MAMFRGGCPKCGRPCEVIFRWAFTHDITGELVRSKSRPFPIPLCNCKNETIQVAAQMVKPACRFYDGLFYSKMY